MSDPIRTADGDIGLPEDRRSRLSGLVQPAPGPETPDTPDKGGRQAGMIIALTAGGAFWAAVGAAIWFLRR